MTETNMRIWSQVDKTAPSATKAAKVGGMNITALNGLHMIMRATEVLGPVGIGWGWKVLEERFDQGAPIMGGKDGAEVVSPTLSHTVRIQFWYKLDGERGEFEQYGCTKAVYKSSYGASTDDEAPKKSLTDAIKKSLSMLGFSADVYLGLFDDKEYVEQRKDEEALETAEDKSAEEDRQKQERLDYIKSVLGGMQGAVTLHELKKLHDVAVRKLTAKRDTQAVTRIARELAELSEKFKEQAA
ncbi:MAG: hypothetical protein EXR84_14060 [Gammaproteobacteria bacterium]|nr:hypothetical protein [Gammaproteobacteria bacterium]